MPDENLRASDADRDRVADRLREALAEGRISAEEHDERIDQLFKARTYGELAPLTSDLPEQGGVVARRPSAAVGPVTEVPPQSAVFGSASVHPVGRVSGKVAGFAMFGSTTIDLRDAELVDGTEISVTALWGGIDVIVPMDVRVKVVAVPIFGGVRQPPAPTGDGGPEITVRAVAWCAGVGIRRKPPRRSAEPDRDTIGP